MNKHALLCSLGLAIALIAPGSSAQTDAGSPGPAEADALTDKARQLYDEGLAALNRSRWAEAHASFLAAWRIKRHYQIASNLGVAELRLGKHRDAAEHLSWYLREAPAERTAQRQRAEALLKEALAKVATITATTVPEGAEVTVDGVVIGRTPLPLPVFLDPGRHVIGAELGGYKPGQEQIEPAAGDAIGVALHLVRSDAEAPAAAVPATAGPRAASEAGLAKLPDAAMEPPAARSWVPVVVLGAASVVGLGVGVGMTVASNDAAAEKDERKQGILREGGQCVDPASAFVERCKALRSAGSRADTFANGARVAFIASGALAAAAVTYVLWPHADAKASRTVLPEVRADGAGLIVSGAF
ncbi:PEGA domain-containing protein [Sorangium sp. So ce291]|uniref:PEGA domain-containing protein n=1 Tax=Sorangium sp. So ce291 TaxID=3133294 RepID=UPI003F5F0907